MISDITIGLCIIAVSVLLVLFGGIPPLDHLPRNPEGMIWPYFLLGLLGLLGASLATRDVLRSKRVEGKSEQRAQLPARQTITNIITLILYVPALYFLGFYITSFAFALIAPPLLGGCRWRISALFAVIFTALLWVIFTQLLSMELPSGYVR